MVKKGEGVKMKSGQKKSSEKWSQCRVVKMKSGQNGKWSKWKVVKMESGQNGKWSK